MKPEAPSGGAPVWGDAELEPRMDADGSAPQANGRTIHHSLFIHDSPFTIHYRLLPPLSARSAKSAVPPSRKRSGDGGLEGFGEAEAGRCGRDWAAFEEMGRADAVPTVGEEDF